jgi:3-methyladenine DNA glycosylase AlkD
MATPSNHVNAIPKKSPPKASRPKGKASGPSASSALTAADILTELKALGKESYKNILVRHGVAEPVFGVSVEELKKIQKRIKKDYQLALDLYDSGVYDAMYLAGLIADDGRMTKKDLQKWADNASCNAASSFTVAWVAAESPHGWELGLKWIESKKPRVAAAGWATLSSYVSITPDENLDLVTVKQLLKRIEKSIHNEPDEIRYLMNGFVIGVGCYVAPLSELALKTAETFGKVECDMGDTSCKVPFAPDYIRKVKQRGAIGKKRKTAKC